MPRYFFHLHNDLDVRDEEGRELPDIESALRAAGEDARTMAAESVRMGHLNLAHFVEVTGPDGRPLFRVTLGEVVEIKK
jgi:hypothetical protein